MIALAATALTLLLTAAADSNEESAAVELTKSERAVVEALREARSEAYELGEVPEALEQRLVATAGSQVSVYTFLLELLAERRIPALEEQPVQVLSLVQEELVLAAFTHGDSKTVQRARRSFLAELEARAKEVGPLAELDPAGRDAVIVVTGVMGQGADVELLFDLAPASPRFGGPFEVALGRLLQADPEAHERLRSRWMGASPDSLPACLRAAAAGGDRRALLFLEDVMRWNSELRVDVASKVQALGRAYNDEVNTSLGWYFEDLIDPADSRASKAAAQALGALRHEPAIPALIEAMEYEVGTLLGLSKPARESVLWALRSITGLSFPDDPAMWRVWLDSEQKWLENDAPLLFARLEDENPAVVADALRLLSRRRLGRDEIAERCAVVFERDDLQLAKIASGTLIQLGSLRAVKGLYWALEEQSEDVGVEAWHALVAITGLDLPCDADIWRKTIPIEVINGS